MKKLKSILLLLIIVPGLLFFTACGGDKNSNVSNEHVTYTITFKNYDGTIINEKSDYLYGDSVILPSETPIKPSDETYTYTFAGWDSEVVAVKGNKVYTAVFTKTEIKVKCILSENESYYIVSGIRTSTDSDIVIPSTYNGKPIKKIGEYAFKDCQSLTSVVIPEGVTSIGEYAFKGCQSLTSVVIPEGVTSIGSDAFYGCRSLTSVVIPESVTSIGSFAFYGCYGLVEVKNLSSLWIFRGLTDCGYVGYYAKRVYKNGESYLSTDANGFITYNDGRDICLVLYQGTETEITIPGYVTSIGEYAFKGCQSLTSVVIPEGVTTIGEYAFENCQSLTSVVIPESLTSIGDSAFYHCYRLVEVKNLSSLSLEIGSSDYGYIGCYAKRVYKNGESYLSTDANGFVTYNDGIDICLVLYQGTETEITIPSYVTSIGDYLFYNYQSLTSVVIPESVTSIGETSFRGCSSLISITIPKRVTSIGDYAFSNCYRLVEVKNLSSLSIVAGSYEYGYIGYYAKRVYKNGKSYLSTSANGFVIYADERDICLVLYQGTETEITIPEGVTTIGRYAFENCHSLTSVVIPESLTSIGDFAFSGCSSFISVTIPKRVTSIGESAFCGCSSLIGVTILGSVTSIGDSAFRGCSSLIGVTIPKSVTSIGDSAFFNCSSLISITIPKYVTSIGRGAFYGCTGLISVQFEGSTHWKVTGMGVNTDVYVSDPLIAAGFLTKTYSFFCLWEKYY